MIFNLEFDLLEKSGVFINFSTDHYADGSNLCFSIDFLRGGKRVSTGWYNDNHEFGRVVSTMESAIKLAKWYLEEPSRIDLINSGYHDPAYRLYSEERSEFVRKLINKTMSNSQISLELLNYEGPVLTAIKTDRGFSIIDQWKTQIAFVSKVTLGRFLAGEIELTDSSGKVWNYTKEPADAKPSAEALNNFM